MDPRQQNNQSQQSSGANPPIPPKGPLDSNQAAELIRQQLNSIYTAQDEPQTANQQASQHFNPYQRVQQSAQQQPQQQVQVPAPQAQEAPVPAAQQPAQPASPYYNPYHKPQQASPVTQQPPAPQTPPAPQPSETQQQPGAAPGGTNYRKNYSTFAIPGTQPEAAPHTPHVAEAHVKPAAPLVVDAHQLPPQNEPVTGNVPQAQSIADLKQNVVDRVKSASKKKNHSKLKPLFVSLAIGLAFLALNYNQVAIAQVKQYISPGASISTPVILGPVDNEKISKDPKIIIPKINVEAPLVYGITGFEEQQIQDGLQDGVVHYANTSKPGEKGNAVYLGHSSNNGFNRGEYKYVFVLLFRLELDDTFIIHHEGTRYVYKVTNKQVIEPNDFSLIQPTAKPTITLITCTPPGTSWKRLVIQAEQISPDPADATKSSSSETINADLVPSNAPSLWGEIWDSIF